MKYVHYRPARLVKGKKWYVEYYYRIPDELQHQYNGAEWKRFRVHEEINRYRTDEYAQLLLKAVEINLADGYNPFKHEIDFLAEEKGVEVKDWSFNKALDRYRDYFMAKGLRTKSQQTYSTTVDQLKEYFTAGNKLYQPVTEIKRADIKKFMEDISEQRKWSNTTYNNTLSNISTIFNWLVREERIQRSPTLGLEQKIAIPNRHRYYTDEEAKKIKALVLKEDPYLYKFLEFIYYTATRPKSEARLLKVEHVLFDRNLLFIPGFISKNKKDDYIPICEELMDLLKDMGVDKAPGDYYLFSVNQKPGPKPASQNYFAQKFKPFKDELNMDENYTIYGFKHLRAIHLAQEKLDPYELMRLLRHRNLEDTMKYLRDLGLANYAEVLKKTRKF